MLGLLRLWHFRREFGIRLGGTVRVRCLFHRVLKQGVACGIKLLFYGEFNTVVVSEIHFLDACRLVPFVVPLPVDPLGSFEQFNR